MGNCVFCGQSAGFFRKKHSECEKKYSKAWDEMQKLVLDTIIGGESSDGLENKLIELTKGNYVPEHKIKEAIVFGWEKAVEHFLEDKELSEIEEKKLIEFQNKFSLKQSDLNQSGSFFKVVKAGVIREIINGKIPQRLTLDGNLPFNFQKDEKLIWVFTGVKYYEDKLRRQYVGASQGMSFRIAKGVYYRVGAFRGEAVDTTQRIYIDTGLLAITNKHLYFGGGAKSLRIRHDKIISHTPFSNGIGIHKDGVTAKPQIFLTGDGWFTYNLLTNISNVS